MKNAIRMVCLATVVVGMGSITVAKVNIETVPVGNPGNAGEDSGSGGSEPGGWGPDRICGAVAYEYNIGKYEVTAGQYCEFLNSVAGVDTYGLYNTNMDSSSYGCQITRHGESGDYTYDFSGAPSGTAGDWRDRPVNYVSWGDAARFANWLTNGQGNGSTETGAYNLSGAMTDAQLMAVVVPTATERETWSNGAKPYFLLTSEDEWYKPAYYKGGGTDAGYWDYPTQSDTVPTAELPVGTDLVNGSANFYDGGYLDTTYYTTEVGAYTAKPSDSAYGTFDQGGNVWEWNEAILGSYRGLRGGSFGNIDLSLHASYRYINYPTNEINNVGFRVSEVPEPATLSLLTLGGLAMLRRRRNC